MLRNCDGKKVQARDVETLANWKAKAPAQEEIPFVVARIVLQDFTGVPLLVDLAAMRTAVKGLNGDPAIIEPLVPVDLVVDHSVQVDFYGSAQALQLNLDMEFKRNRERYQFLKWGQQAFQTFGVVPPGIGIVHQVNLEYLAKGVLSAPDANGTIYYPDTLVGTDSHTTMINGLGVVGWGVGGIEAEAGMLGQPVYFLTPEVVGVNLTNKLREGVTATDLALHVTQLLRAAKVVGKFVEFYGEGAATLPLTDRATIANMAPEYGATMGFFPVDAESVNYLAATGRTEQQRAGANRRDPLRLGCPIAQKSQHLEIIHQVDLARTARHAQDVDMFAVGVQVGGQNAGCVAGLEHHGAGAIGEDRPTRQVGEFQQRIGELLAIGGGVRSDHDDPAFGLGQQVRHGGGGQ